MKKLSSICLLTFLLLLAACDSAETPISPALQKGVAAMQAGSPEFLLARRQLVAALSPNSIDDIYVKLADRFDGFGGAYENEKGEMVLVSKHPESTKAVQNEVLSALLTMMGFDDISRRAYMGQAVSVQSAVYSFTELAVYRDIIERKLRGAIPLVLTDVDERRNLVVIGLDEAAGTSPADVISKVAQLGIPSEAVVIEMTPVPQVASGTSPVQNFSAFASPGQLLADYVRPLAGGLQIDRNGRCTLGIPVWYGNPGSQTRGFLTASHCTGYVGYNNNSEWGQPLLNKPIGTEIEDPPLTNCGAGSTNCQLTDAALIDLNSTHDNRSMTLPGHVYLTDFSSSTGPGGYTLTGQSIPLNPRSPIMGAAVNKVGARTGWTTGEIMGTCVNITLYDMRHPDGVIRPTLLNCYIRASTPVNVNDSGAALFSLIRDPDPSSGGFLGILSACERCSDVTGQTGIGYYVSWAAIDQAMTRYISLHEDNGYPE